MSTMDRIAMALQGFGAGVNGRGPEFMAGLAQQEELRLAKEEERKAKRRGAMILDNRISLDHLRNGRVQEAIIHMEQRLPAIQKLGGDPKDTVERIQKLRAGDIDFVLNDATLTDREAVLWGEIEPPPWEKKDLEGLASAKTQFWDNGTIAQAMPDGTTQVRNPRGDIVTGDERVKVLKLAREEQVEFAGKVAASGEEGKLGAQIKLKPELEALVVKSRAAAQQVIDQGEEGRSNAKALKIYQASIKGLSDAMGQTYTGPFVGLIPSITSSQQGVDAAAAAMVPALKAIFRGAGEGTFSDGDRDALMAMLPGRGTNPEAARAAINNINTIVMAKLGMTPEATDKSASPVNTQGWQLMTDAAGNKAYVGPNGEIQEVE